MVQHSPAEAEPKQVLDGQIRETFGRVVYSHKTHEKCADILLLRLSRIKLLQIVLSAISTCGFLAIAFGAEGLGTYLGVVISTLLLALNTYTKDYDLGELAQKHKQAANDLWIIRETYLSLIADISAGDIEVSSIRERRDELLEDLHNAYTGSPATNYKSYRKAQVALQKMEDMTFSDEELNGFLPKELHR